MKQRTKLPPALGQTLAVAGGLVMPVQARLNGALAQHLQDNIAAALVSFVTGLVVAAVLCAALPRGRAGVARIVPALRLRQIRPWYMLCGLVGAYYVLSQAATIGVLGVALFTVAVVAGSSVSGLMTDSIGFGPAGRRRITPVRLLSVALILIAVTWAVSPRFGSGPAAAAVLPLLMPLAAGLLQSPQQGAIGFLAVVYRTPLASTLVNFLGGTLFLTLAWLAKVLVAGPAAALPGEWWLYLGGPLGCLFVVLGGLLVKVIGVLQLGLGVISGQMLGSLVLDLSFPTPGTVVAPETIFGTVLTLAAVVLATLPWPAGALRTRAK
ncbi:DMT family transporter [Paenarthrobacter sp. Z7-10]|uniref:DMT family transporter n=1 Tax=Paenarthrobacter sp. Z7-10 TaxID=2787635 RepID=UPI0022A90346|nr:DMT family transporter [Paenarthrobacter sp. Z7-10]MCZ2404214.1 DMT family transporter [Paenarthrobacter sp. Z7-10]